MSYVQVDYYPQKDAFDGMLYDHNPNRIDSMKIEGADIAPGRVVSQGTNADQCTLAGAARLGVLVRGYSYEGDTLVEGNVGAVIKWGRVWAKVNGTGVKGAALTYDNVTGEFNTAAVGGSLVDANATLITDHNDDGGLVGVSLALQDD